MADVARFRASIATCFANSVAEHSEGLLLPEADLRRVACDRRACPQFLPFQRRCRAITVTCMNVGSRQGGLTPRLAGIVSRTSC